MIPARRMNSRDAILDAAEAIVAEAGAAHLTLDAAAERAGVSKGGLLYNFPSKEALLQAMVARHLEQKMLKHSETVEGLPPGVGQELMANLLTAAAGVNPCGAPQLGVALIAACANNPKLLEPIRELHRRELTNLLAASSQGLDFARAAVIGLALDGLRLTEMLQVSAYDSTQRQRILDDLRQLVDETVARAQLTRQDPALAQA